MSSTAIVSKMLVERTELNSRHGRLAIGVLLFQDLAVVPLLILVPALAMQDGNLPALLGMSLLKAAIALSILLVFGKKLINPWFELVARQNSRELFVMNVLMVTLLLAVATKLAGLSYALGAFVAGMLISETRYRYQVESDIAPFRDILLGLFFVTVGMLLDIRVMMAQMGWILLLLSASVLLKGLVVTQIARVFGNETGVAIRTGFLLAQAGEFSFVVLALGAEHGLLTGNVLQVVIAASLLSMVIAPFVIQHNGWFASRLSSSYKRKQEGRVDEIETISKQLHDHVIICGFGRSGQYLSRFLNEEGIPFIALDVDPARIREASGAGENVVFGDAGRRVVLRAAGADRAKALVISYADNHSAMKVLLAAKETNPQLPVIVRTMDDSNMEKFIAAGAKEVVPEVLEGSLMLASHALVLLGVPLNRVVKRIRHFREERYQMFRGFFHGRSDFTLDEQTKDRPRLHSVALPSESYACGKRLLDLNLASFGVEIKSIRRPNAKAMDASPNIQLAEGDMVVLLGTPDNLSGAETYLLSGK
jgi:CPA2 family monovalent cation:H+ antiporter-2